MTAVRLVVIGDSMLDVDIDGTATRLSPEAPVPVIDGERLSRRPGGAGLAAALAAGHGADVELITVIGQDDHGRMLRALLDEAGVHVHALPSVGATACKTRIRANGQHVVRLDQGPGTVGPFIVPAGVRRAVAAADAICVADYGRGITKDSVLRSMLSEVAGELPVVWDPHPRGTEPIAGVTLVTPNDVEARHFSPDFSRPDAASAHRLRHRWKATAVCVTLGARGALLATAQGGTIHLRPSTTVPAHADTCGAGDRFAVAAAAALADGADPTTAAESAVDAATGFVASGGASAMSILMPLEALYGTGRAIETATISDDPGAIAAALRQRGGTLVATGGCFDLLHTGHIRILHQARQLGAALVVLLNSDVSVRALKGPGRPVMRQQDRARVLAALACVDAVCIFDGLSPERTLDRLRPDIWVKGGDYVIGDLPEAGAVRAAGGEVVLVPTVVGYSSSGLIDAARARDHNSERLSDATT
jgi:D-beta-D-heptose 7-phosphate kinase/D-beta-D-heptose 1-phosphate adenosyltransferase